jgi:hypothetical protein
MAKGLGLGLGLGKKGRTAFTGAISGGQDAFSQYMAAHPNITKQLGGLETGKAAASKRGQNWAGMTQQYGITPVRPGAPAATPGGAPLAPKPPPAATQDPDWYSKFVSNYELPMPKELTTAGDAATANLSRLNAMPLPSYQEQFGTYKDLMERELDKQTADLTEAYGARGGRYTSDLTTASADMRRKGLTDLSAQGITAMTNLNQQRMQELGGTMQVLQGVGASRGNIQQQAAQTAWQNYLMGTSPPEMMDKMLNWSSTFSPPGSVVTQQ